MEFELYAPVKAHMELVGYVVRGEVGKCDAVGVRPSQDGLGEEMVAVELKPSFGLPVIRQAVQRLPAFDLVYIAVGVPDGRVARDNFHTTLKANVQICRMLGLGLLFVRDGQVHVACDPAPYQSRKSPVRRARLLSEFNRRSGDHNVGGTTRQRRVTAYREDCLRLTKHLSSVGAPVRPAHARDATGVVKASGMLRKDAYGWFRSPARGLYVLTPAGHAALLEYADVLAGQKTLPPIVAMPRKPARKTARKIRARSESSAKAMAA